MNLNWLVVSVQHKYAHFPAQLQAMASVIERRGRWLAAGYWMLVGEDAGLDERGQLLPA